MTNNFTSASGADHRADVAAVEHGARLSAGARKPAERRAAPHAPCHDLQPEMQPRQGPERDRGSPRVSGSSTSAARTAASGSDGLAPTAKRVARDGPIERAGIEMGEGRNAPRQAWRCVPLPDAAGPSMAMIIGNWRQAAIISSTKFGKLVAIMEVSSTVTGEVRAKAQYEKAHGDAMIHMGLQLARRLSQSPVPAHDQIVAFDARFDTAGIEPAAVAARRSLSLTFNSSRPCICVSPFGEGGDHGENGIFVDHGGGPLRRHVDAAKFARFDAEIADRLAALFA